VVDSVNVGSSLISDSFDATFTLGTRQRICAAGSPQLKYSPSFGANIIPSEVRCALNNS